MVGEPAPDDSSALVIHGLYDDDETRARRKAWRKHVSNTHTHSHTLTHTCTSVHSGCLKANIHLGNFVSGNRNIQCMVGVIQTKLPSVCWPYVSISDALISSLSSLML